MELWFNSDWHLFHENIIRMCNRPFSDANEMTEALIERHNKLVKPEDHFTTLGDVTMIRGSRANQLRMINVVKRFNGHKRLIMGNHDHFPVEVYLEAGFEKVYAMNVYDNMRFTHIAVHPDSMGMSSANIHGHIHNGIPNHKPKVWVDKSGATRVQPYINLSLEMIDYTPVSLGQIKEMVQVQILKELDGRTDTQIQASHDDPTPNT